MSWWWRSSKQSRHADGPRPRRDYRHPLTLEILEERTLLDFSPAVNYPVIGSPQSTAVGDFNGDGIQDLAVINNISRYNGAVSVLLGNGDGTFRSAVSYLTGGVDPIGIVAGEFRTGSGIVDLVVANRTSNTLGILLGNGDGTFQGPAAIMGRFSGPSVVKAGHFTGDGNLDLAVTNGSSNTVSVLLGNGDGTFQPPVNYMVFSGPRDVIAADVRGIGVLDLVLTPQNGSNVMVLLGNGDGTFQAPISSFAGDPSNVTAGDFNGDGNLDLAVTNRNGNSVSVLLGNGDGTFQPPVTYVVGASGNYPAIAVGDLDQDGNLDLVATNEGSSTVSVLLGNGDGSFQAARNSTVGSNPLSVIVADLNGDGYPDLAVNNLNSNNVSILLNDQNWGTSPGGHGRDSLSKITPAVDAFPGVGVLGQALAASLSSTSLGHPPAAVGQPALFFAPGSLAPVPAEALAPLADGKVDTLGTDSQNVVWPPVGNLELLGARMEDRGWRIEDGGLRIED